eukprot:2160011-Pleurochrysis_carterae.AAC.1
MPIVRPPATPDPPTRRQGIFGATRRNETDYGAERDSSWAFRIGKVRPATPMQWTAMGFGGAPPKIHPG